MSENHKQTLLKMEHTSKSFGGVTAIENINFNVFQGETVGIVGDNGAGKSTLIKIISGVYTPDKGTVLFNNEVISGKTPKTVREKGIETIYQDLALVGTLDTGSNVFLGRELVKNKLFNTKDSYNMVEQAKGTLNNLGFNLPNIKRLVHDLSGGQQQGVAIARAVHWEVQLLIMDEPTAALGVAGRRKVYNLVKESKQNNIAVLYVTPNIREIFDFVDKIIVIRRGKKVIEKYKSSTTINEIIGYIVGSNT